jgi:predicted transcriptional regulator
MSHTVRVSNEIYKTLEEVAARQGLSPEALAEAWLKERVAEERDGATPYSRAWLDGLDDALAQAKAGQGQFVGSTEELLRIIDVPSSTGEPA